MRKILPEWALPAVAIMGAVTWVLVFLIAYLALPALVIGSAVAGLQAYEDWRCAKYSEVTGHPTEFVWFDDCYVERDGRMQPRGEYEAVKRYLEVE